MSDNNCLPEDDLRRKRLSFKKKLIFSKYKKKRNFKSLTICSKNKEEIRLVEEDDADDDNDHDESSESSTQSDNAHFDMNRLREMGSIQVSCNSKIGHLVKKQFGSGGKGKCIRVKSEDSSEKWFTPIEFENYSGKGSCRDWKRTIKVGGVSLMNLIENEILICHAISCSCAVCNQNTNLVGPIRPMIKYRRRKKDEILAQNAYKKFLSLKPPTILAQKLQKISNINQKKQSLNLTIKEAHTKATSESQNEANLITLPKLPEKSIGKLSNSSDSFDIFNKALSELQDIESKQWSLIENESKNLMTQVQNFHLMIQETKKQMELNRQNLLKQFLKN